MKHLDGVMARGASGVYSMRRKLAEFKKNVTVTKEWYLELLCDLLKDCSDTCCSEVFRQVGAPVHRGKLIKERFEFCRVDSLKDWPGNSPDLRPIKNFCAIIKRHQRRWDTSFMSKLVHHILEIWTFSALLHPLIPKSSQGLHQ